MAKCTYGTGNFVLVNIGAKARMSKHKLLTTVAYSLEQNKANYAFEGSIFITGAAIQWLRDEMKIISSTEEAETMAKKPQVQEAFILFQHSQDWALPTGISTVGD